MGTMIETAVLLYGLVASIVMSALEHGARERRAYPPTLALAGWSVMSFSATFGLLLTAYAAYVAATGAAPPPTFG